MYLPTFWKLVNENRVKIIRDISPWVVPITFFGKI